jgi:hypothetical protein
MLTMKASSSFPDKLDRSEQEGRVYWHLNLGAHNIRKENPEELDPIREMHPRLVSEVLSWRAIQTFRQKILMPGHRPRSFGGPSAPLHS